jgi:hypothetical protein
MYKCPRYSISSRVLISVLLVFITLGTSILTFKEIETKFLHNLNILEAYISRGLCKHFYIDMGTNTGIQLRKLYQPDNYPGSPAIPYFDRYFGVGKPADTHHRIRHNVCSIGFEPNHLHWHRLLFLQNRYRMAGYPMVIFVGTAVWTENENLVFYELPDKKKKIMNGDRV